MEQYFVRILQKKMYYYDNQIELKPIFRPITFVTIYECVYYLGGTRGSRLNTVTTTAEVI